MQKPRRHDETGTVANGIRSRRQLLTMGIAMENRKKGDDDARRPNWWTHGTENQAAKDKDRHRDAEFDRRNGHAGDPEHTADSHDGWEDHGQQRDEGTTKDGPPQADREHRQHVIGAGKRVRKASGEPALQAGARMRGGWRRQEKNRKGDPGV
ncbi:hypothetical protein GCM10007973_27530 [Polymorphobacter multimanifer]|nr:hypothetical protein GCM10007973_27530 [Polymorphobacter multimanifer]